MMMVTANAAKSPFARDSPTLTARRCKALRKIAVRGQDYGHIIRKSAIILPPPTLRRRRRPPPFCSLPGLLLLQAHAREVGTTAINAFGNDVRTPCLCLQSTPRRGICSGRRDAPVHTERAEHRASIWPHLAQRPHCACCGWVLSDKSKLLLWPLLQPPIPPPLLLALLLGGKSVPVKVTMLFFFVMVI